MKRIFQLTAIAVIILASLLITTCDNIALGDALNLKGPVVEILGPVSTNKSDPEVSTLFNLHGTASSDSTVASMSVTLTYFNRAANRMVAMGREWKYEGGTWQTRENSNLSWRQYSRNIYEADIEASYTVNDPSWSVSGKTVSWNLPVYMYRMEKGQFFVSVKATDSAGLSDSNSLKRLKIDFNSETPTLKVDNPLLLDGEGSLAAPIPPTFSGLAYLFDPFGNPRQTYDNRANFVNRFPDFRWTAEHPHTLEKLIIEITNEHNLDTGAQKKVYYHGEFGEDPDFTDIFPGPTSKANHSDGGIFGDNNMSSYIKIGPEIKIDSIDQPLYKENIDELMLLKDRITPLQIVTAIEDINGKREYKSKGWFLWLPESDKPFVDISFGSKVKDGAPPTASAFEKFIMRGTSSNRITFYDDKEGLASATWTLTKLNDTDFETDDSFEPVTKSISFTNGPTSSNQDFTAEYNYGVGRYKIEIMAEDLRGTVGDTYTAYFAIISNTAPTILDWDSTLALPDGGVHADTRWGDNQGNITIFGSAAIEGAADNSVKVDGVSIVLLNYEISDVQGSQNELRFTDPSYSEWARGTSAGYTDNNGNKIFTFPAPVKNGTISDGRDRYDFTKTFNWFTDLNGNQSTKDKKFIVRAVSKGVYNREYYGTKSLTIRGDDSAPVVDITTFVLEKRDTPNGSYYVVGTYNFTTELIPAITQNHRIMLKGTWSDNSSLNWTNLAGKTLPKDLFKYINVRWEGNQEQYNLYNNQFVINSNGTWETSYFSGFPLLGNSDPLITISVAFQDLAGNMGAKDKSMTVETDTATLSRISSESDNGRYGGPDKKIINIFLGFNKPIYMSTGANTNTLKLILSNGARASYVKGFGDWLPTGEPDLLAESKIIFEYVIGTGDNETNNARLNVTGIEYGDCTANKWKSQEKTDVAFPAYVFNPTDTSSFAQQKNIVIDKTPPAISVLTTSAADGTYGIAQEIAITVQFNEDIDTASDISSSTTYLNLRGGNLQGRNVRATYNGKTGKDTIQFLYKVSAADGDNSQGNNIYVNDIFGYNKILDKAGNEVNSSAVPARTTNSTNLGKQIKVNTVPPSAPTITSTSGVTSNYISYDSLTFNVTNIATGNRWEYHTNYTSGIGTGWQKGSSSNQITITANGSYSIAARQFDVASPENGSTVSNIFENISIDSGPILTKVTSANASGTYGFVPSGTNTIDIELEFRKEVWVTGTVANAYIILNTTGGTGNAQRASLKTSAGYTNTKKLTYTYNIVEGVATPTGTGTASYLNLSTTVTNNIVFGTAGASILDAAAGKNIESWVTATGVTEENRLNRQKEIIILAGRPAASSTTLGTTSGTGIWFRGNELGINFNRAIYRGTTETKLLIRQIADNYRIPAVLTEQKFNDIFIGRDSMFDEQNDILTANILGTGAATSALKAERWEALGKWLYSQGSNGATESGGLLTPDTAVKYVLRFVVNTENVTANDITGITGITNLTGITMANLTQLFRAAEALTFTKTDPNVTIDGNNLKIALTGTRALPVRGATYEWVFPNGFVTDTLGRTNASGTGSGLTLNTGTDANISSATNGTRRLVYNTAGAGSAVTVESPVIRIDKGDDLVYFNNDLTNTTDYSMNRQARQKLTTTVKMDVRTPGATIAQSNKTTMDKVRPIIMRTVTNVNSPNTNGINTNNTAAGTWRGANYLPNLGSERTRPAWEAVRMRPQSGGGKWNDTNTPGLNVYTPIATTWNANANYTAAIAIGTPNYSDGGQEYNFRARATLDGMTNSAYAYETAYRSVLVYSTTATNGNGNRPGGLTASGARVWIRGSNTPQGDPTIPDFPLSRSGNLWRKIKLLTPINAPTDANFTDNTNLTVNDIPDTQNADGYHLWFWVTWRINVPAFVDIQYGVLPTQAQLNANWPSGTGSIHAPYGTTIRKIFKSFITSVEHYAVHPGRTTIVETRVQGQMWDGDHGALTLTDAIAPIEYTDR
jgi:hypothetical protein